MPTEVAVCQPVGEKYGRNGRSMIQEMISRELA
jgi:hypothetical protein